MHTLQYVKLLTYQKIILINWFHYLKIYIFSYSGLLPTIIEIIYFMQIFWSIIGLIQWFSLFSQTLKSSIYVSEITNSILADVQEYKMNPQS